MANLIADKTIPPDEKIRLMQRDARFDIASSTEQPDLFAIRQGIHGAAAPPKAPKVFLSNDCVFNCAYCGCRSGNDCKRAYQCSPRELAELSVRQAQLEKQGIFLTSAIFKNPDYTQELLIETLHVIRGDLGYGGYVHAKVMPGTDPALIHQAGTYADRLSVNIEVAHSEGYRQIARNKNRGNILTPMGQIARQIRAAKAEASRFAPRFATSQTTQIMAGSTGENDRTILTLSGALYKKYALSRVYYQAYHYDDPAAGYDQLTPTATPKWRVGRLYQADRLMRLYGFTAEDVTPESAPDLPRELDPKAAWALRNLHLFPVEVNRADFELLIRVPGIGITYAKRILKARQYCTITHDVLKSLGVSLKRSRHFLTCKGKYAGETCENPARLHQLLADSTGQLSFNDISPAS